jgi:2-oxoglutarate ferredoxin oxidoreductase subunit gamma
MAGRAEEQIVITGFGGQGIILTGNILGKAATLFDRRQATLTQSYGPEARGGACSAQVIISNSDIAFPYVEVATVLVCLSQEGYEKNLGSLGSGGLLLWDSDLVAARSDRVGYDIPASRFAEELGNTMMANIVMLGFLSALSDLVTFDALREAVAGSVPPRTKEKNLEALNRGRDYGKAILKSRAKTAEGAQEQA